MRIALLVVLAQLAWGSDLDGRQTSRDVCNTAMRLVKSSRSELNGFPVIDGQAAHDCLMSLPFQATKASAFITELKKYVQFQSTLDVLKNPPSAYLSPAVDIMAGLDKIAGNDYDSQYEFDVDVYNLFSTANDGHFVITPCSATGFRFIRSGGSLVSISKDGLEAPSIYLADDMSALMAGSTTVSPVASINGQDVIKYLETIAATVRSQDPDARWNSLFASAWSQAASPDSDIASLGAFAFATGVWPGSNNTQLEFKNGSTIDLRTVAMYTGSEIVSSSAELYTMLCVPTTTGGNVRRDENANPAKFKNKQVSATFTAGPASYPTASIRDPENKLIGYNLDAETDVMFIPTFEDTTEGIAPLSEVASEIVSSALANGRTKFIIDLSANGGGTITRAFDLFKLFFPSKFPYSATRMRRHEAMELMILGFQDESRNTSLFSPFFWKAMVNPAQDKDFASVDDFLNGGTQLGTNVTSLFANFNYTASSADPTSEIRGFGGAAINDTQPFKAEDILIITDGVCASTCTTFVNLMTNVGGVRAVAFGGRPRLEPMQIMGGVRGGQSMQFSSIDIVVKAVSDNVDINKKLLTQSQIKRAREVVPKGVDALPFVLPGGGVNLRDAYQEGADNLPLQFEYQASDCRLFYTAKSIDDPSDIWVRAKAAVWGDKGCVNNSTGGKGSLDERANNNGTATENGGGSSNNGGNGQSSGKGNGAGNLHPGAILSLSALVCAFVALA